MNEMDELRQYVSEIVAFSSEFNNEGWSCGNLRGAPTCNSTYGDHVSAWCPARYGQEEFVEVKFLTPVYITQVRVYENLNGGTVTKIEALESQRSNAYETIWMRQAQPEHVTYYRIFDPTFDKSTFRSNQLKITFSCTAANYFSEIDAIELVGTLTNIYVPIETLVADIGKLLTTKQFCDAEVNGKIQFHKCIVSIRCPLLFDYLEKHAYANMAGLNEQEFTFIIDFIYTDKLNEVLLKQLTTNLAATVNDTDKKEEFRINKLTRFAIKFELTRLHSLILNYLLKSFLTVDNVLDILLDALCELSDAHVDPGAGDVDGKVNGDFILLEHTEQLCMDYIKINLPNVVHSAGFENLPKHVMIRILQRII